MEMPLFSGLLKPLGLGGVGKAAFEPPPVYRTPGIGDGLPGAKKERR